MMIPHLLVVGIVEGVFTMGVLSFLLKTAPNSVVKTSKLKANPLYILLGSLTIFTPLGLLAKGTAWGEWGKEEILNMLGYIPKGMNKSTSINAIMSDYSIKNLSETYGIFAIWNNRNYTCFFIFHSSKIYQTSYTE